MLKGASESGITDDLGQSKTDHVFSREFLLEMCRRQHARKMPSVGVTKGLRQVRFMVKWNTHGLCLDQSLF